MVGRYSRVCCVVPRPSSSRAEFRRTSFAACPSCRPKDPSGCRDRRPALFLELAGARHAARPVDGHLRLRVCSLLPAACCCRCCPCCNLTVAIYLIPCCYCTAVPRHSNCAFHLMPPPHLISSHLSSCCHHCRVAFVQAQQTCFCFSVVADRIESNRSSRKAETRTNQTSNPSPRCAREATATARPRHSHTRPHPRLLLLLLLPEAPSWARLAAPTETTRSQRKSNRRRREQGL